MALVWLMMYFSICLMIIISICSMIIVSREYFEITFIYRKKRIVLTVLLRLFSFRVWVSTIYRKIFYDSRFEMIYDFHFEMSKGVLFTFWNALWLSFWNEGDKIFVHKIISVRRTPNILLTKIQLLLLFSYTVFYARLGPYPCVEIKFLEKGDGLLCQILIILQS